MAPKGGRKKAGRGSAAQGGRLGRLGGVLRGFLFGSPVDEGASARLQEIKGLVLIGFSLWLLVSLASYYTPYGDPGADGLNWGGRAGFYLANAAVVGFGWAAYLCVALGLGWGVVILTRKRVHWPALRLFGTLCLLVSTSFLLQMAFGPVLDPVLGYVPADAISSRSPMGPGGWLALTSSEYLADKFGGPGLAILLVLTTLIAFLLATEMAFYPALAALGVWIGEQREAGQDGPLPAVGRWLGSLFKGLWDFLRGADLEPEPVLASSSAVAVRGRASARPAAPRGRGKVKPLEVDPEEELWEADDDEEDEEDEEEDEDEEDEDEEDEDEEDEDEEDEDEEDEDEEDEDEDEDEDDDDDDDEEDDDEEDDDEDWDDENARVEGDDEPERELAPAPRRGPIQPTVASALAFEDVQPPPGPWKFPPLDLLEKPTGGSGPDGDFLETSAAKLEHALRSFRVEAEVVAAQVGPAVTMFELTVAQGTRMNKVTQLSQEIAAALRAKSVRIIAPIPGKATIGIEVPNAKRRVVRMRELISAEAYDKKFMALPLFLGQDATGEPIVEDLARMPHLLIAGTTGSGKSVCINTILASLLLTRSPHDVKMILVDPKMVELMAFAKVPHLMLPVVTDVRQATNVLNWAVEKMEGRYELLKDAGCKNIKGYNALGEEGLRKRLGDDFNEERTPRQLSYIVVVIDEMADLMMVSKKEAEQAITRLAQKSRAVGIHVIVATQRPSTDVITGVLKGNLPTRIAFQVASKIDSRVILDAMGAEKLLGSGDMLYTPPQSSQLKRVQGALVEDHELQAVIDFVCSEAAPNFNQELVQTATGERDPDSLSGESGPDDPLFDDAVRVVLRTRRGSASLLQRALSVGYTRASRLIDLMTEHGILGDHRGSKSREILLSLEDWEEMHGQKAGQGVGDE